MTITRGMLPTRARITGQRNLIPKNPSKVTRKAIAAVMAPPRLAPTPGAAIQ
jgi:hypothetical protein